MEIPIEHGGGLDAIGLDDFEGLGEEGCDCAGEAGPHDSKG